MMVNPPANDPANTSDAPPAPPIQAAAMSDDDIIRALRRAIRIRGGNVQAVLGGSQ